jgi:outer membrane protein OmpA-like peptidoglycan-associated protein
MFRTAISERFKTLILVALCAAAATILPPKAAVAQEGFQADQFEPLYDQESNILNTFGSDIIEAPKTVDFSGGVFYHYAHRPLRVVNLDTNQSSDIIASQHKIEPWLGFGFFNIFDIGLVVPLVIAKTGDNVPNGLADNVSGFTIGDIRVTPKIRIMDQEKFGGFGLAVAAPLYMPTGDPASYTGQGVFRAEPRLILDYTFSFGLRFAANVGFQFREKQTISNYVNDNILRWSFATEIPLGSEELALVGSVFGDAKFTENINPRDGSTDTKSNYPIEAVGALRFNPVWGLQLQAGGGAAVTSGVGAPEFRVLASLGYQEQDTDSDGDGYLDSVDKCPQEKEDFDNFMDEDGCPEPDNDEDTILDASDQCPTEKEDIDTWQDDDGCPDPDNDNDGLLDGNDTCPIEAEDFDSFEDADGCPEPDNDKDGVCEAYVFERNLKESLGATCRSPGVDQCVEQAEDMDGFGDDDGCPDPDNDNDGFCDPWVNEKGQQNVYASVCKSVDKCPDKAEIINGVEDEDGCPDEGKPAITVVNDKIELEEQIFFDTGKATIKAVSFTVLDQVATVMQTTPRIIRIRIEGHTDDVGNPKKNLQLSKDRAASVMAYLVKKGIDPARLSSEGYGQDAPLVDPKGLKGKDLKDARSQNRRVEIKILELAPVSTPK